MTTATKEDFDVPLDLNRLQAYINLLQSGSQPESLPHFGIYQSMAQAIIQDALQGKVQEALATIEALRKSGKFPQAGATEKKTDGHAGAAHPESMKGRNNDPYACPPLASIGYIDPALSREPCPLMDDYIQWSRKVSPRGYEPFHENTFLFIISTIAARRVAIPYGDGPQYTPLAIFFIGDPNDWAKSFTAKLAIKVLASAGLSHLIGDDQVTPSYLLTEMSGIIPSNYLQLSAEEQANVRAELAFSAQRGWYYDEAGELIQDMVRGQGIYAGYKALLLKFDNCPDTHRPGTQKRGRENIEKPYLPMLASMTIDDMKVSSKSSTNLFQNGFWSRTSPICPPEKTWEREEIPQETIDLPMHIWRDLRAWHNRLGVPTVYIDTEIDENDKVTGFKLRREPFHEMTCQRGIGVKEAFRNYEKALDIVLKQVPHKDLKSPYGRLPIRAMRVAALLASLDSRDSDYTTIELRHWARAQEIAESWRLSLHELYRQINTSSTKTEKAKLEDEVKRAILDRIKKGKDPIFTASNLRENDRAMRGCYSSAEIEDALRGMARTGFLGTEHTAHAKKYYINPDNPDRL